MCIRDSSQVCDGQTDSQVCDGQTDSQVCDGQTVFQVCVTDRLTQFVTVTYILLRLHQTHSCQLHTVTGQIFLRTLNVTVIVCIF